MSVIRNTLSVLIALITTSCTLTTALPTPTAPPTSPPSLEAPPVQQPAVDLTPINPNCAATPADWISYVVEPGDTLTLLAEQTGSTTTELVEGNCLDNPDQINVDTIIFLPRDPVISP